MDTDDVVLVEYQRLRDEIDNRTQIANGLVALQVTALGAGLAIFEQYPDVVVGVAVASTFLWLLWIDQARQVCKLAAYIGVRLTPVLRDRHGGVLGWEGFLRRLDRGGPDAAELLGVVDQEQHLISQATKSIELYTALLFGGSPLALLAIGSSTLVADMSTVALVARAAVLVISLTAWTVTARSYWRYRRWAAVIDRAIEGACYKTPVAGVADPDRASATQSADRGLHPTAP